MPKFSRATRATRMFELSPLVTAASAPAPSMPASMRRSRSKPMPCTVRPENAAPRRTNDSARRSMMATVWPSPVRTRARDEPTRPQPTMTTCTVAECKSRIDPGACGAPPERRPIVAIGMVSLAKRILIGRPIATSEEGHQRLRKRVALPIFASDAISSTAYATDEVILVLTLQAGIGLAAFDRLVPIAIVVAILLTIVVLSYRQTIHAYPSGGGAYVVSRENLGEVPALVAGASLLTDYILTVAVSVAGGVLAIQSAFDFDAKWRVPLCLLMVLAMTVANLRGL